MPTPTLMRLLDAIDLYLGEKTHYPSVQNRTFAIPFAYLSPADPSLITVNNSHITNNTAGAGGDTYLMAPVELPHGSRITSLTTWTRTSDGTTNGSVDVDLKRTDRSGSQTTMASTVNSSGNGAVESDVDSTITNAVVDNENYSYHLVVTFQANTSTVAGDLDFLGAEIACDTFRILDDGTFA